MASNSSSPSSLSPSRLPSSPQPAPPNFAIDAFMGTLTIDAPFAFPKSTLKCNCALKDVRIYLGLKLLILDHIQRDLEKLTLAFPI
ncbi:hypothetical protein VNO80_03479 [Phaseolus coccineus]|uniref:Uncharacterized protein n=1 Tax=Phaseolus coccineus TaxID=3886 RepID=A0AAN9NW41_PHACN